MRTLTIQFAAAAIGAHLCLAATTWAADGLRQHSTQYQPSAPPARTASPPIGGSTYDRYSMPPASTTGGAAPPPDVLDQAARAATDAGNSLRREFDTGFQQANDEAIRVGNRTLDQVNDFGRGVGTQVQDFASATGRNLESAGSSISGATQQSFNSAADALGFGASAPPPGVTSTNPNARAVAGQNASAPPLSPLNANAPGWSSSASPQSQTGNSGTLNLGPPPGSSTSSGFNTTTGNTRPAGAVSTATGWSSLDKEAPAPPLATPSLAPPEASLLNNSRAGSTAGTGATISNPPPPVGSTPGGPATIHSQLVDPASRGSDPNASQWGNNWSLPAGGSSFPSTPGNGAQNNDPFNRGPLVGDPNGTASGQFGPPPGVGGADRFGSGQSGSLGNNSSGWPTSGGSQPALPEITTNPAGSRAGQGTATGTGAAANQKATGTNAANPPARTPTNGNEERPFGEKPWMPLVFVSLTLISSLGANLFLGWSYVDARLRYQTLARNTADKFRRVAEAA